MLSPWLDQIVFAHRCGWPSISEMLSPVDGAAAAVDGCGWPSISEMLSRSGYTCPLDNSCGDRKSVVSGKRVSVRVDLGGRRIIKKKKRIQTSCHSQS